MSDCVRPHRRQPTNLPRPWDSPGKNTGVGCHFLLHCVKVKSETEVAQSCPTLSDPMDCSPPGFSIHGIFQARVLEWGAIAFSVSWYWWFFFFDDFKKHRLVIWRSFLNLDFFFLDVSLWLGSCLPFWKKHQGSEAVSFLGPRTKWPVLSVCPVTGDLLLDPLVKVVLSAELLHCNATLSPVTWISTL